MTIRHELLQGSPYRAYAYAYPHKTAYRPLARPLPLGEVWAAEPRDALFLYLHIPFCEMRCGFCNLFTTANPRQELEQAYLAALEREARQVAAALGGATFARLAIGGGTPTYLQPRDLARLFDLVERTLGIDPRALPVGIETSPHTADEERLRVLRERGVTRVSIGVQSFVEAEAHAAGRAQRTIEVEQALGRIREAGFPTLNVDLIYGLPGQSVESWLESLAAALRFAPEELYLYPLYVRPLTGLGRQDRAWDDIRLACYRAAREILLGQGYEQVSMRMFRRQAISAAPLALAHATAGPPPGPEAPADGPLYCCQEDGLVGLGCGARSYTRALHYSRDYAVSAPGVRAILSDYVKLSTSELAAARYGFVLDAGEQRRRYVIKSLLQVAGLDRAAYQGYFGRDPCADLPQLLELRELGLAEAGPLGLRLTAAGLERSDAIGPWLFSPRVQALSAEFELR